MAAIAFEFHASAAASIESLASDTFGVVRKIDLAKKEVKPEHWWRPEDVHTLTDKDILGDATAWLPQVNGEDALVFMWHGQHIFGLTQHDYSYLIRLVDAVLKVKWVQKSISSNFIEAAFIDWARKRLNEQAGDTFCEFFLGRCTKEVAKLKVIVPVQHLAVEEPFQFGPTMVRPLGPLYFDSLRENLLQLASGKGEDAEAFVGHLRKTMSNCSALEFEIVAEPNYAKEAALLRAADAIGLLRFFCVATVASTVMSPVTLLGALAIPQSHVIICGDEGSIRYSSGIAIDKVEHWRISRRDLAGFLQENLAVIGGLLELEKLSEFERAVRSGIIAFSRAITFPEISDRLVFALSAIEGLMLRNQSEPIQQNVAERIAFLTTTQPEKRQAIVENFRKAYKTRSQYIHHRLTTTDVSELDQAFENIRAALAQAVVNLQEFDTKEEFLLAIDNTKLGF
jgi:Apea-like HEPN